MVEDVLEQIMTVGNSSQFVTAARTEEWSDEEKEGRRQRERWPNENVRKKGCRSDVVRRTQKEYHG